MAVPRAVTEWIDKPLPDLTLSSTQGTFATRGHVGVRAQVLFFYVHNGTGT